MTLEEKNKILSLRYKENKKARTIAIELGIPYTTVSSFLATKIIRYDSCPVCGKEVPIKNARGRRSIYCSLKCRNVDYKENRKRRHQKCVCEYCGKEYLQYTFVKSRFCSRSCAMKYRNGKQRV